MTNLKSLKSYRISFSDNNRIKLGISNIRKTGKFTHVYKLKNTPWTTNGSKNKSKGKLESILRQKHNISKLTEWSKGSTKREVYSGGKYIKKIKKTSNKALTLHLEKLKKN